MRRKGASTSRSAFTLIELLCVIAIIAVLGALLMGPALRVLQRVRADKWGNAAPVLLDSTLEQLTQRYRGQHRFPTVTLERLKAEKQLRPAELGFLRDRRVTFTPFSGADPDELIVITVELQRGFLTEPGYLTLTKGAITREPE